MLKLKSIITLGDTTFDYVVDVKIKDSWEEITTVGTLSIPNRYRYNNEEVRVEVKRETPVTIQLGYTYTIDGQEKDTTREVFRGYVSSVEDGDVIKMRLEDPMFLLKQKNIQAYTGDNLTIKQLIEGDKTKQGIFGAAGVTGIAVKYVDETSAVGDWRIQNKTVAQVLYELRKFGLYARFDGETLNIDTPYTITLTDQERLDKTKKFKFQYNMISDKLEYRLKEDLNTVVQGVSHFDDDTKLTLYAYYNQAGEVVVSETRPENFNVQLTKYTYNLTKAQLNGIISKLLPTISYQGYYGSFLTFGHPYVAPGDFALLYDDKYPDRSDDGTVEGRQRYIIKSVEYSFGKDGYRQNVELGIRG